MNESAAHLFESHFLRFLTRQSGAMTPEVRRLLTQLVRDTISQHSCLQLNDTDATLLDQYPGIGSPAELKPVVKDGNKLYFARFYQFEKEVAAMIAERNTDISIVDPVSLKQHLDNAFGTDAGNRQKLSALLAITRKLAIITGGPGTGKTSTVVKILDILFDQNPALEVKLAAPTGKAAMRLDDSIQGQSWQQTPSATTLHRLLGMRRDGRSWRHGSDNPVSADLLIVDEASMIDLTMMHRLLCALAPHTRLILLGDPHQLPSVDTGNVLADLCAGDPGFSSSFQGFAENFVGEISASHESHKLTDAVCELNRSYRFSPESGIGQLAAGIRNAGEDISVPADGAVTFKPPWLNQVDDPLLDYWPGYADLMKEDASSADLLIRFEQSRILCSRRGGPQGVEQINSTIESKLELLGIKQPGTDFYPGRPVLVTRNDYNLGLFNGDIGICIPFEDDYVVVFPGKDDKRYLASRLPQHETCFAMTVHKSQGSEFDHVILMLADESSSEAENLMTRELLYTAVTRAKERITVFSSEAGWRSALHRSSARVSGMTQFLKLHDA